MKIVNLVWVKNKLVWKIPVDVGRSSVLPLKRTFFEINLLNFLDLLILDIFKTKWPWNVIVIEGFAIFFQFWLSIWFYGTIKTAFIHISLQLAHHSIHIVCALPLSLALLKSLRNTFMLTVLFPTWARPCTSEPCAISAVLFLTLFRIPIMLPIWMLAKTFKIVRPMCWYILKSLTLTSFIFAWWFTIDWIEMFVLFESMVAKTLSLRANHFALVTGSIFPTEVKSVDVFILDINIRQSFTHDVKLFVVIHLDGHFMVLSLFMCA